MSAQEAAGSPDALVAVIGAIALVMVAIITGAFSVISNRLQRRVQNENRSDHEKVRQSLHALTEAVDGVRLDVSEVKQHVAGIDRRLTDAEDALTTPKRRRTG